MFDSGPSQAQVSAATPTPPNAPAPPPMFGAQPQGKKPKRIAPQGTFLGTGDMPQANPGGKTLLGQ